MWASPGLGVGERALSLTPPIVEGKLAEILASKLRDISAILEGEARTALLSPISRITPIAEVDIRTSIRPTVAVVNLGALRANAATVRKVAGRSSLWSVIKADAYGHGAVNVARALAGHTDGLAVSLVEEGLELRAARVAGPIMVLGAFYGRHHDDVVVQGLTPVVANGDDLARFSEAGARRGIPVDLHLKIDTGMSRLGLQPNELPSCLDQIRRSSTLRLAGVATHLACADGPTVEQTQEQLRRFRENLAKIRGEGFSPLMVHAANSAATLRFAEARFDAVRPGLALYGVAPSSPQEGEAPPPELRPVLSLRSRVMALRDIPAGEGVSYGWTWRARRPSRIGTLPIGYADGYPRHVQGAEVLLRGRRAPVVGAVCMDMLMLDLTDVPGASIDDEVTLIGQDGDHEITVDELAAWAGTISYEILCGISKRVPRQYVDS